MSKSGALFREVVGSITEVFTNLSKKDAVIIFGGTNDVPRLLPILSLTDRPHGFSSSPLDFSPLIELSSKTNIIVCTIPFRDDHLALMSTNIYNTNQDIVPSQQMQHSEF